MVTVTPEQPIREKQGDIINAYNSSETDLITGLSEDVVLGEVVPRLCKLPWKTRPVLSILNRQWNKAMTERFPIYHQRVHNAENFLFNAFILSHTKQTNSPSGLPVYTLLGLWVYKTFNNNGSVGDSDITIRLPEHPFSQVRKYNFPKFVCDNHRVFSLTPSVVTEEPNGPHDIYNVWMLDLRDFSLHWKRLPGLPKLGNYVYASSSLNGDESSYMWQRRQSDSLEAEGWKLSSMSGGKGIDITSLDCEWHWEYVNVNSGPPGTLNFDKMFKRLPLYIEIERRVPLGSPNQTALFRELYRRCPIDNYVLSKFGLLNYVVIVPDGIGGGINECSLCYMKVEGNGICLAKVELKERTRVVEEPEWGEFVAYWINEMRAQGAYEMPNKWYTHSRERSAIKVFKWPEPCLIKHEVKLLGTGMGEVVDEHSIMTVAQKGPIYGYSFLGVRSDRIL